MAEDPKPPAEETVPEDLDVSVENLVDDELPEEQDNQASSGGSRTRGPSADGATAVEVERDQYKELAQRMQADFENYKKRVARQEIDLRARAEENLVIKLLPVLDTIDLALAHDPNGSLEQVRVSLLEVLQKEGLERVAELEAAFDPTVHEAVAHEPGEGEQRVSDIMRAGYRWNGRVVRPAMVKVIGS